MTQNWKKLGDIAPSEVTPMIRQYIQAKADAAGALLFFRMGDFYEMFFEDAVEASELLGLTLTSRDAVNRDERIPMAGVPVRTLDTYVARCVRAGRSVAICEQLEDPKDAKGVVKREVTRTITPGTVMESNILDDRENNYLAAVLRHGDGAGLAFVDVSTGEFLTAELDGGVSRILADEMARMNPAEVLVSAGNADLEAMLRQRFPELHLTQRPAEDFDADYGKGLILDLFELGTLKGIALDQAPLAVGCSGALLVYIRNAQRDGVPQLRLPRRYNPASYVVLDGNTQRNLELVESLFDKRRTGTLLSVMDRTLTCMGGRMLRQWLLHPLMDVAAIRERLDAVAALHDSAELRMSLREPLRGIADMERLLARLTAQSGNARDLRALGTSLALIPEIRAALTPNLAPLLDALREGMDELRDVTEWITAAIVDEPPLTVKEGGLIRDGYDAELDRYHGLVNGGRDWIAALQRAESDRTGISTLKVGYNKVFGYFIEITRAQSHLAPPDYERKQTLVNAERYVTPALKDREEEILHAQERMATLEYTLFSEVRRRVNAESRRIQQAAGAIAALDVLLSFAEVAAAKDYVKPEVDDGEVIDIKDGRHPVVESLMKRNEFVPNNLELDPSRAGLLIMTGPNMAGKSTYLRQVALLALMAQTGSFIPASKARIGVVDRIFTRVGASDNLARGESTFMVEMIETANILNSATRRSLIVLDEIGRGTSTFDGISIAWAVAEHIHDNIGAKTLFATHYHELTELASKLERARNISVAVREWGGKVVFLYQIIEGGADHSYGIQVAKLAGLPPKVITRARDILHSLESGAPALSGLPQQLYLFGPEVPSGPGPVEKELATVDPDALSPREAHDLVYHLKHLMNTPRK